MNNESSHSASCDVFTGTSPPALLDRYFTPQFRDAGRGIRNERTFLETACQPAADTRHASVELDCVLTACTSTRQTNEFICNFSTF
ncbi:hypothetical protein PAXRUDRAFT_829470 [Paxillus rubicundulus Ve08.2h10]|uniref:Uncharacterized protein n=1 Tax=Paxillus rubicundulus Ve08.2h10 TaxID=930991 RepID=A0A0D0DMS7_9AGAM|nr:hypothetical protein PAXRUDRAFT_829470 [Paxillus rubicundulus Ve08.2h10]